MSVFNEVLRDLMYKNNLSVNQTAKLAGLGTMSINNWLYGEGTPNMSSLIKLSDLFGVSIDYLVYGKRDVGLNDNELERLDKQVQQLAIMAFNTASEIDRIRKQYERRTNGN